jgi:hypothetical protein
MTTLYVVLLLLAVVCFAIGAARRSPQGVNLVALGLMFFALVPLIEQVRAL